MFGHISHTGFGRVTKELAERFVKRGIDVRVIAVNHRGEPIRGALAGRVWPANINGRAFGDNISSQAIDGTFWRSLDTDDEWAPDLVLVVEDMSGLIGHIGRRMTDAWRSVPVLHYCPIEGDNLPPHWREIWQYFIPVAMSRYGARIIGELMGEDPPMVYHGVDTEVFRPVSVTEPFRFDDQVLATKEDCKRAFGLDPNRKLVLRCDRFVQRKFYDVTLKAMSMVFDQDPDVDLLIHCRPEDEGGNLLQEMSRLPEKQIMERRVALTNAHNTWTGLPEPMLAALYNAADLYLTTTSGEGFGLTIAEALACGVPVVSTGYAAEKEVVGPGGILVEPLHDSYGEIVKYHSTYGMDWAVPDAKGFVKPVLDLLAKPARRRELGKAGRRHVVSSFQWDNATDDFVRLMELAIEQRAAVKEALAAAAAEPEPVTA
jgi:glycosyltransferase involved in cell wall biosynthesis